jgi:hypothetical protein
MSLTRQEVFQALTEGKKIELVPRLESCDWLGLHTYFKLLDDDVFESLNWCIKAEAELPKWYENIPSHGVLCWLHDNIEYPNSSNSSLAVIIEFSLDGNYIDQLFNEWFYATPLTNEEIKQFLRGE